MVCSYCVGRYSLVFDEDYYIGTVNAYIVSKKQYMTLLSVTSPNMTVMLASNWTRKDKDLQLVLKKSLRTR